MVWSHLGFAQPGCDMIQSGPDLTCSGLELVQLGPNPVTVSLVLV
jgi:hypothetical protein